MSGKTLTIRFWGTRGSSPPLQPSLQFGIHTTCVEIASGKGDPLLVDLGTGAVGAARNLLAAGRRCFNVFLTHVHSDHVNGIFLFSPLYQSDCRVHIRSPRGDLEQVLGRLFGRPVHPVELSETPAELHITELPTSGSLQLEDQALTVSWVGVPHPQGCFAYRFDDGENALVFATDVELARDRAVPRLEKLLSEPYPVGMAVVDGFFSDAEIEHFSCWGHSTWQQAVALAGRTGVRNLVITHHHPARTDDELQQMVDLAAGPIWAREGQSVVLSGNELTPGH